jgi:hypothetical protein
MYGQVVEDALLCYCAVCVALTYCCFVGAPRTGQRRQILKVLPDTQHNASFSELIHRARPTPH